MTWTLIFDLDKLAKGQNFQNISMENLPKYAWILCVRHNLLLAELCALRARCLQFQMLLIIVSTPSGNFKADRLNLFLVKVQDNTVVATGSTVYFSDRFWCVLNESELHSFVAEITSFENQSLKSRSNLREDPLGRRGYWVGNVAL